MASAYSHLNVNSFVRQTRKELIEAFDTALGQLATNAKRNMVAEAWTKLKILLKALQVKRAGTQVRKKQTKVEWAEDGRKYKGTLSASTCEGKATLYTVASHQTDLTTTHRWYAI